MTEQENDFDRVECQDMAIANREIRRVPLNWQHPVDQRGNYQPLGRRELAYTEDEIEEGLTDGWLKSRQEAEDILMPDFSKVPEEEMGICAYERTSEGTPISPVCADTPEGRFHIAKHCSENQTTFSYHKADIEAWAAMLYGKNTALVNMQTGRVEINDTR